METTIINLTVDAVARTVKTEVPAAKRDITTTLDITLAGNGPVTQTSVLPTSVLPTPR